MTTKTKNKPLDFYFWLGADGELSNLTLEEFLAKIEEERELERKWRNVSSE